MSTALPSVPRYADIARLLVLASHLPPRAAPPSNPHSARCLAGAQLPATSCLGRLYFSSQEIDSRHVAAHRSTDYSRSGCRMCYFCHAQLFEITHLANIKSTLVQHSCRNAEVVEAFCRVAASRSDTRRSIH